MITARWHRSRPYRWLLWLNFELANPRTQADWAKTFADRYERKVSK